MTQLRFVVVGDPIEHSLSPQIHQAALDWCGIAATYGRRQLGPGGMPAVVDDLRSGRLAGVNVTMPNKTAAAECVDVLGGPARRAKSVNTLWCKNGEVLGETTDVEGIRWALGHRGIDGDLPVLLLGSGGAAAAALLALEGRSIHVSARNPDRVARLLRSVDVDAHVRAWGRPLEDALVVNATPLGMAGEPLPDGVAESAGALLDMTYGFANPPAVAVLRSKGAPVATGELMLVGQAAASFVLWTGVAPPRDVMLTALENAESDQ